MSLGSCAAVLKTASRANPVVHLPYRPRARATPRTASRNVRRYDGTASSGSVVGNDPVNKTDPTGEDGACIYSPSQCSPQGPTLGDVIAKDPIGAAINVATAILVAVDVLDGPTPDVGAAAVVARSARAERMAANAAQGARGEAATAARLGTGTAGRRVTLEASNGKRSVVDFVTKKGSVIETKTGGSPLSAGQKAVQADIKAGTSVTPRGANAEAAGLRPGQPTPMKCYIVTKPSC